MEIEITQEGNTVRAVFDGHFDTAAAEAATPRFNELNERADKEIVLDFTRLEYISSSGLRLLIGLRKNCAARGGKVIIEGMNDMVRGVFTMTGFSSLFEIK